MRSASYNSDWRSMYGLRTGSFLLQMPVWIASLTRCNSVSSSVSFSILDKTMACSISTITFTCFSVEVTSDSSYGKGCRDM